MTIQIKATEQYLPVVLFIGLYYAGIGGLNLFLPSVSKQERLVEWNPIFSTWAILSFFSDSPTSCSLERWRWTTLKKSQTLLWEQIKRLETLSLQTIFLAPREVNRLVLKKTSKVKKSKNKNRDQPEHETIFSCRFWVWENSRGMALLSSRSTGRFSLKKYKAVTGSVNMVYKN